MSAATAIPALGSAANSGPPAPLAALAASAAASPERLPGPRPEHLAVLSEPPGVLAERPAPLPEPPAPLAQHLAALPGGAWALWRTAVLRGAGFPACQVLRLAAPAAAAAADRVLRLEEELESRREAALAVVNAALDELRRDGLWEDRERRRPLGKAMQSLTSGRLPRECPAASCAAAFAALAAAAGDLAAARAALAMVVPAEAARVALEIADVAREGRFREAVLWQNRAAVEGAFDGLAERPPAETARTSRWRRNQELVASYLQRYCAKNDTIGFFGPVGFARLADEGGAVAVRQGAGLVEHRAVYFEGWCIDALAERLGCNPALRPWLAPRLKSSFHLAGNLLHRPFGAPIALPDVQARLVARCDGRRLARDLARDLAADPVTPLATEAEVYRLLDELCRGRVLVWALQVPPGMHPDRLLAALLARVEAEPLRREAMAPLEELQQARDRVALAAGDPGALAAALRDAEGRFTRLTGARARHRPGETYAARELLYEDCRRGVEVAFGPELTRRLGPPLTLLLRSARWVAGELARRLQARLRALHAELRRRTGADAVDCSPFFSDALAGILCHGGRRDELAGVARELQARWSSVLGPLPAASRRLRFSARALERRVAAAFGEAHPAWTLSHYLSPDVMIAAAGEAALRRGDFELVLGEIHAGNTLLWSCFVSQHPAPEQLASHLEADTGAATVVVPQLLRPGWPRRISQGVILPAWHHFQFMDELPPGPRPLPAPELLVEETAGGLRARTRDGRIAFPAIDLFAGYLAEECSTLLGAMLEPARHVPRVSIDAMVVSRERWHLAAGELGFAEIPEASERFLALRRWARGLGLPRFCFFKVATERKPCYLDLASPISGDVFLRLVRAARAAGDAVTVALSEMLPRLDQAWLSDGQGNLYTSELRLAALDRSR